MSATSGAIGCSSDLVVVTTTRSGGPRRSSSGWDSRRSSIRRAPTVSTPGDSRSWGSVSQDGNIATASPNTPRSSVVRSSASRPVAVTTSNGPAWASAEATNTRAPAGPTTARSTGLSAALRATSCREGSRKASSTIPAIGVSTWVVPEAVMMHPS